jgi:2',3'-cyclic-nucleotide 2'-phosphodiesterase (5'-nucleotidase family)
MEESGMSITADEIRDDKEMESIISPYRSELEQEMNTILCVSENAMVRARPESELGNFVSDLCLARVRSLSNEPIDCALFNYGGLRTALPKGAITRGKIFELMPFENELVIVELPVSAMYEMMEYLAFTGGEPLSDIQLHVKAGRVVSAQVQGQDLTERTYRVLTSDYLAGGGDKMVFLTEAQRVDMQKLGLKIRDAILDHCEALGKSGGKIDKQLDGRISIEE